MQVHEEARLHLGQVAQPSRDPSQPVSLHAASQHLRAQQLRLCRDRALLRWGPLGYGRDGIAVAADGELAASFREGGMVFGRPSKRTSRLEQARRPSHESTLEHSSWAFTSNHVVGNVHTKSFDDILAFSPRYLSDSIVFGASFLSVYVSFDRSDTFQKLYAIPNRAPTSNAITLLPTDQRPSPLPPPAPSPPSSPPTAMPPPRGCTQVAFLKEAPMPLDS